MITSSTEAKYRDLIMKIVPRIGTLDDEVTALIGIVGGPETPAYRLRNTEFAFEAIAQAGVCLAAAINALKTLELTTTFSNNSAQLNITNNGWAGLIRQTLEASAYANWLLEDSSPTTLQARSFGAMWDDARERRLCMEALGAPTNIKQAHEVVQRLVDDGKRLGLTKEGKDGTWHPIVRRPAATDLMQAVELPSSVLSGVDLTDSPGYANAQWLYRWVSGLAHGYPWASLANARTISSVVEFTGRETATTGISNSYLGPNKTILGMSLYFAVLLTRSASSKLAEFNGKPSLDPWDILAEPPAATSKNNGRDVRQDP